MNDDRKLPSKRDIRNYWAPKLVEIGKFDSIKEATEADYCFACGFAFFTYRCHILARIGRSERDGVENLHLLCEICHTDSEALNGPEYWEWLEKRTLLDRTISAMMQSGCSATDVGKLFTCRDLQEADELIERVKLAMNNSRKRELAPETPARGSTAASPASSDRGH